MYRIMICQSVCASGSVIIARTLATLYENEVPDDIETIVEELGGDYYDIQNEEDDDGEN